jgi:hypothetical protein
LNPKLSIRVSASLLHKLARKSTNPETAEAGSEERGNTAIFTARPRFFLCL